MAKPKAEPAGYQGWTNYETWAVNLWITNDEPSYRYWRECAGEARAAHGVRKGKANLPRATQAAAQDLADRLESELKELIEEDCHAGTLAYDLLGAALSEVNWVEIAENFLAD